jgi:hypothetical protein
MSTTYLGKEIPTNRIPPRKKPLDTAWLVMTSGILTVLGASSFLLSDLTQSTAPPKPLVTSSGISRTFAEEPPIIIAGPGTAVAPPAASTTTGTTTSLDSHACDLPQLQTYEDKDQNVKTTGKDLNFDIFPLLPHYLNEPPATTTTPPTTTTGTTPSPSGCYPALWGLDVLRLLSYKVLSLLNWLAFVIAILTTVYSGLLYIGGFANEGNIKKAKSLILTVYVGLAIVLLARVILYGTIKSISDGNIKSIDVQLNSTTP